MKELRKQINNTEQYLRINNLEIIGLPEPTGEESHESILLKALNSFDHLEYEITSADIDISHPIPTKRKDGKTASVCKFVSQAKLDIIAAKRQERELKYNGNTLYINEHLSPANREIFSTAQKKEKNFNLNTFGQRME